MHRLNTKENNVSNIADICATQTGTIFKGDVLVTYEPTFAKNLPSPTKAPIVHVDLVDSHGHMPITVNITNQLVDRFMTTLFPGASVCIKRFLSQKENTKEVTQTTTFS